jgi:hypothetical protein
MRLLLLTVVLLAATLFASYPEPADLKVIDEFNACIQLRFAVLPTVDLGEKPQGILSAAPSLIFHITRPKVGMSRIAEPPSPGEHFRPSPITRRDFYPEDAREAQIVSQLESQGIQGGFYLIGKSIIDASQQSLYPRALKGPAVFTAGTPRANWYPASPRPIEPQSAQPDALPDWNAIYPVARSAMKTFLDGGKGFETSFNNWHIAARPVVVSQVRCIACHTNASTAAPRLNDPIGAVLYAFRRR